MTALYKGGSNSNHFSAPLFFDSHFLPNLTKVKFWVGCLTKEEENVKFKEHLVSESSHALFCLCCVFQGNFF